MPVRRMQSSSSTSTSLAAPSPTSLGQQQHQHPSSPQSVKPSPSLPSFTRSASPSGLSNFLSRPTKWFTRTSSSSRASPVEPRASTSSTSSSRRRPTISGPTDPRPIDSIVNPGIDTKLTTAQGLVGINERASRSVLDLSSRSSTDMNGATMSTGSSGTGDLRSIARRGWSRSVDNLQITPPTQLTPLNTSKLEMEMKIEQYRTGTPTTPASLNQKIYPFPTMPGTPSTPPSDVSLHQQQQFQYQHQLRHAHSNSGSSTSLAAPSPSARLAPPMASPQKAGRKRSFDFERSKGKSIDGGTALGGGRSGGGFPFYFGSGGISTSVSHHPERKSSGPGTAATPTIIEPRASTAEEEDSSKRASQIVHRSGFILRLQTFSPSIPQLSSNKNWKPFKMVLKGSKLYFHKPPSDRSAAIKELFPSGLVAVVEGKAEGEDEASNNNKARRDREEGRKRRAFWGRRTHPDLVIEDGQVLRGTLEALVHESVFGTAFFSPSQSTSSESEKWKTFASSIVFFVPYLVDRVKFEHEFQRCVSYFINGADESEKDTARARVAWLVARYIAYHLSPADEGSWRTFCSEVIPATAALRSSPGSEPKMPRTMESSPNLNTFSPRPGEAERMPSLSSSTTRLGTPISLGSPISSTTNISTSNSNANTSRMRIWSALDSGGFTREVLFKLEPDTVARSLLLYQRSILEAASVDSSAPTLSAELLLADSPLTPLVEFFGCEDAPHWLTRTVIMQILGPGHFDMSVLGGRDDHQQPPINSRTHIRAEVIARWARVGEMSRLAGDECSWRAIMAALCSKPIARLEKAWRRVDSTAMNVVRGWVYASAVTSRANANNKDQYIAGIADPEQRVSPWGGDGRYRTLKLLEKLLEGKSNEWACEGMTEAKRIFDDFVTSLESCQGRSVRVREASDEEDAFRLSQYWKEASKKPPPMKIHRIDQFMSLSFAAEPRKKGLFAPYYWSRTSHTGPQALVSLLIPELLPTITLIDRSQIIRTKKTSYESSAMLSESQSIRPNELVRMIELDGNIRARGDQGTTHRRKGRVGNNAFDLGGMILPVFDGELLLRVVAGPSPSHSTEQSITLIPESDPGAQGESGVESASPSRQPSIRVKSAAAGLDRKSSRARRASLPALSRRDRSTPAVVVVEPTSEPPLHAVVQAGTLDALVHFLIHGLDGVSVSVADDNGEMALRDKKTRAVKIDRAEFARVWWPTFRSFVTPYVFFQLLRKDFLSASPPHGSGSAEGIAQSIQARQAIIRVVAEWIHIGGGTQDALDDIELHASMQSFLSQQIEHALSKLVSQSQSEELSRFLREYEAERLKVCNAFIAQTMRPQLKSVPVRGQATGSDDVVATSGTISAADATTGGSAGTLMRNNFGIRAPKLEEISPNDLVENLDAMASAAFRNVNQEDLYVTSDLLEVQTSDRTGWFLPHESGSITDEIEVQSLYTFLMEVEPTSLIGEYSGETLYRRLPPGVRSLLRAYCILRKWAVCCLAAPKIGAKARQARMEMFLKAVEICRYRSVDLDTSDALPDASTNPVQRPCVRSFVEAVLTSAIVSPESRVFSRAWQAVASARGTQMESLLSLLATRTVGSLERRERLTVDPAWILERVLEVISLTDVLDSPMDIDTPLSLVNFDKRRQLHNIIANASSYVSRGSRQRREMDRMDFERLNRIEQEVQDVMFDLRFLRDEAQHEATAANLPTPQTPSRKGGPRPFQKVIAAQQEKIKRDRYTRERLLKEKRHEQQRLERKEDDLNRAMDVRGHAQSGGSGSGGGGQKHQRGKRSMSALFSLMRPISTAFTSESGVVPKRSAAELDFTPTHKPSLVLSLVDAHVTAFINNDRSFTFQIDTEDGGHYLLQALSRNDMTQWMQTISTAIKSHAQRRLTYIGDASPIQVPSDHVQHQLKPLTALYDPKAVFGVDLTFLVRREAAGDEVPPDAVPIVLELCLKEIEQRGLTEQGIYRVAGATSEVTALREALNNGQRHIDRYTDINAVCGVVKYWFRTLPETVIPETYFEPIIEAARLTDLDERLAKIRKIVHTFPRAHFSVLKRLAEHMDRVVDYEEQNHMTPDNLAVVICPNLLRAPNNNFGLIMKNMGPITVLFKALITHMHLIFDEETGEEAEEADAENEAEVDYFEGENDYDGEEGEGEGLVYAEPDQYEDEDSNSISLNDNQKQHTHHQRQYLLQQQQRRLLVPEVDLGPRFVASPEPDELLQSQVHSRIQDVR